MGGALGLNTDQQEQAIGQAARVSEARIREGISEIRGAAEASQAPLLPFQEAGLQALPQLQQGATLQGFGQNIGDIFSSGALDPLVAERQRAATGALSQAGLTRSGQAGRTAAEIPAELAFSLENLLQGRQRELVGIGQGAAGQIAQMTQADALNIAQLLGETGQIQAQAGLGIAQAQAAGSQNLISLLTAGTTAFGASDSRFKTNIERVCEIGGLTLYRWDWVTGVEDLVGDDLIMLTTGFIAQDVEELYPEFTGEYNGLMTIDYDGLLKELNSRWLH